VRRWKWTDPPRLLPFLVGISAASVVIFWFLGHNRPDVDWSLLYNGSFASLTATTAAQITLWVYGFLAEESQRREWRHDQEMRHFEAIYGPLYVDTRSLIETLKRYRIGWLEKWRDVNEGPFGPFVEPTIVSKLDALQARLSDHSGLNYESEQSASRTVQGRLALFSRSGTYFKVGFETKGLVAVLVQDQQFLFDPDAIDLAPAHFENLRNAWQQIGPLGSDEWLKEIVRRAKEALLKDELVQKRVAVSREILPLAEAAHASILNRMKDPFD
jgi:hypothetical protein